MRRFHAHLALFVVQALATGRRADAQEAVAATTFAEAIARDVVDVSKAGGLFPLTLEARRTVRWGDAGRRVEVAARFGPVRRVDRVTCTFRWPTTPERCSGHFYICSVRGQLATEPLEADIAICRSPAGPWQLSAMRRVDEQADPAGAPPVAGRP